MILKNCLTLEETNSRVIWLEFFHTLQKSLFFPQKKFQSGQNKFREGDPDNCLVLVWQIRVITTPPMLRQPDWSCPGGRCPLLWRWLTSCWTCPSIFSVWSIFGGLGTIQILIYLTGATMCRLQGVCKFVRLRTLLCVCVCTCDTLCRCFRFFPLGVWNCVWCVFVCVQKLLKTVACNFDHTLPYINNMCWPLDHER